MKFFVVNTNGYMDILIYKCTYNKFRLLYGTEYSHTGPWMPFGDAVIEHWIEYQTTGRGKWYNTYQEILTKYFELFL